MRKCFSMKCWTYLLLLGHVCDHLVRKPDGNLVLLLQIRLLGLNHLVQLIVEGVGLDLLQPGVDNLVLHTLRIDRLVQDILGLVLVPELRVRIAGDPVLLLDLIFTRGEVPGTPSP